MNTDVRVVLRVSWWVYPLIRVCAVLNRVGVPVTADQVSDLIGRHGLYTEVDR